jgi:glutaryl-CoA dehydrogenase
MKPDLFQSPDYYNLDDLLTEEHKLVRDSARACKKKFLLLSKTITTC